MSSFAIDVIVRGFILMSSAWAAAFLLRRRSASLRAGVWTVAFAGLLALPTINRVAPSWKIEVLPAIASDGGTRDRGLGDQAALFESESALREKRDGGLGNQSALRQEQSAQPQNVFARRPAETPTFEGRVGTDVVSAAATEIAAAPAATPARVSPIAVAIGIWAAGAVLLLVRLAANRIAAGRLIRSAARSCDGDAAWRDDVEATRAALGIRRRIGIRFTDAVAVPAVIGIWRPTLLLPPEAGQWSAESRRVVILHELAHVARWDAVDQLMTEAGCALYWILPPVWIAARSSAVLREQATDDAVIRAGVKPSSYAAELIELAESISVAAASPASLAMAGSRIQDRVHAILDPAARRGRVTVAGALALAVISAATVTTLAAISPERQIVVPPVPPAPPAPMAAPAPPAPPASRPLVPALAPIDEIQVPPVPPAPPAPPASPAGIAAPAPPAPPAPWTPSAPLAPPAPPLFRGEMAAFAGPPAPPAAPAGPRAPSMQRPPTPPTPPRATGVSRVSSSGPSKSTLCPDGRDSLSNMSNNDGNRKSWSLKVSGHNCTVEIRAEGAVEFNAEFTDVASITPSGYFRLTVSRNGARKEVEIDGRGSSLTREYRVDGKTQPYDAAAKSWFEGLLIDLDRETAIGVDARLPKLLKQGGVDAVLKETALITSDYARSKYYTALAKATKLSPADNVRILNQAASLGTQDYYAAELLKSIGAELGDSSNERAALLALVDTMRSDYYIVESVNAVFATRQMTPGDVDMLLRVMPRVDGDYYKLEMLKHVAGKVTSDAGRQALIAVVTPIKSAYYLSEGVRSLVRDARMSDSDLMRLVDVVKPMREDYYKSESLRAIARHANANAKVRQAVADAAASMSSYYREEVLRAVR